MLNIKTEYNGPGKQVHSFVARGTKYTVFQNTDTNTWEVWSSRQALGSAVGQIRTFNSLKELSQTSKTFRTFAEQIN